METMVEIERKEFWAIEDIIRSGKAGRFTEVRTGAGDKYYLNESGQKVIREYNGICYANSKLLGAMRKAMKKLGKG